MRPNAPPARVPRLWSAAVALLAFALYLALCPPVSGDKDSAEFTVVLARLGVAHPTGYPLYTLLGHLWVTALHALGTTWAFAANAWTALGGAVGIHFLQRLALGLMGPVRLSRRAAFGLSALPALVLALNPVWTYETTLVEVYAWHVAWTLGAATLFLSLVRKEAPSVRDAALWGLVCGIGAAHHATSVFVIVPLSGVLIARKLRSPVFVLAAIGAGCLPLASYAFIPWRETQGGAAVWPMLRPGVPGLIEHLTGRQYVGLLGKFGPSAPQMHFLTWYVWPFLVPGLVCLVMNARRTGEYAIAGAAILGTVYSFSYGVPDPSSYFLFPLAYGLAAVPAVLAPGIVRGARALAWGLAAVFVVLSIAWFQMGAIRSRTMVQFDGLVQSMWRSIPYEKAFVFWNDDMHYKLEERQLLLNEKPGLFIVNADVLRNAEPRRKFAAAHGFDPMPASTHMPDQRSGLEDYVNRKTDLPVLDFDPVTRSVKLLRKP